jgi:hypothetical protein
MVSPIRVVMVFGAPIEGWPQLFPTVGCVIPCGVWSYSIADAECLLHGVGPGSGFRIVLVFCSHRAIVEGADRNGKRVRFDLKQQDCIFRPPQLFGGRGISPADCIFSLP